MAISGIVQAADLPARLAFVPDLVPKEDLINAVGLNSLLFNSARAIGPACAGLLFLLAEAILPFFPSGTNPVTLGAIACFAVNAISFVAVLIALFGITIPGDSCNGKKADGGSTWDGFRYLAQHPTLGGLMLLTLTFCIFGWPLMTILPAYTRLSLNLSEQTYSLLLSAVGAGALIAALTTATFGTSARRGQFLILGAITAAIGLFGISQTINPELAAIGCAAAGFGMILYLSTGQSTMQLAVPDEVRGRVMALWAMTLSASAPIGHLLVGQLAILFGVGPVILGMALGVAAVAVALTCLFALSNRQKAKAA
jgi:MFS family permease